jgi:aspartyl-tRNA(Asn)/glutamyl-tRNA(Gln) amidotransferase subunit A
VCIGKTNLDEFAMGSSTESSAFGPTKNPHDLTRVPGGGSGGSAAAVAAGMVRLALGSSTGGSIRQPAAYCGVVGIKPTYGLVSRFGLVAYGSSFDQIGPLAASLEEAGMLLRIIVGRDEQDSTSVAPPARWHEALDEALVSKPCFQGLRIGVLRVLDAAPLQVEIAAAHHALLAKMEAAGATIVDVDLPLWPYSLTAYYLLAAAEASANLARFDGVRYGFSVPQATTVKGLMTQSRQQGFGLEVKRRILMGTFALSKGYAEGTYNRAQAVRRALKKQFSTVFESVDCLFAPTTLTTAFPLGAYGQDPLAMYQQDQLTVPANLVGIPALSQPVGLDERGLPMGMQWMGSMGSEPKLLAVARSLNALLCD